MISFVYLPVQKRAENSVPKGLKRSSKSQSDSHPVMEMPTKRERINSTTRSPTMIWRSYFMMRKYRLVGRNAVTILEPSNGGTGIRLKNMSVKFMYAAR